MSNLTKRYECMFTIHINKKPSNRVYCDGYLRVHHANKKAYLLSLDFGILAETFYSPNKGTGSTYLPDSFKFNDGDEVEFDRFIVIVGDLLEASETNLAQMQTANKEARAKAKEAAKAWALDGSFKTTPKSRSTSSTSTPSTPSTSTPSTSSTSSNPSNSNLIASKSYKGFSIAPPSHKPSSSSKPKSNALIRPVLTKIKPRPLYTPYPSSRPGTKSNGGDSDPLLLSRNQNRPSTPTILHKSPYTNSTPSKATSLAFKPPTFLRK